jgi:PTS system sucrose-specific IIC component
MGKGAAIIPTNGEVFAPCDGRLTVFFETGHAYGFTTNHGAEVLVHIGIDTVNLNGKFFTSYVQKDQLIKKGDKLCSFDLEDIKAAGYDPRPF